MSEAERNPPVEVDSDAILGLPSTIQELVERWGGPVHLCALVVVLDPDDRVLMLAHPDLGWSFPGGHSEPGESWEDVARRELSEETGLVASEIVPFGWNVNLSDRLGGCAGACHVCRCYLTRVESREVPLGGESGPSDIGWFERSDLPDPHPPDAYSILAQLER